MTIETEHDYAVEARMILMGLTGLLPTIEHLRGLDQHYQARLRMLADEMDVLKMKVLQR